MGECFLLQQWERVAKGQKATGPDIRRVGLAVVPTPVACGGTQLLPGATLPAAPGWGPGLSPSSVQLCPRLTVLQEASSHLLPTSLLALGVHGDLPRLALRLGHRAGTSCSHSHPHSPHLPRFWAFPILGPSSLPTPAALSPDSPFQPCFAPAAAARSSQLTGLGSSVWVSPPGHLADPGGAANGTEGICHRFVPPRPLQGSLPMNTFTKSK